MTNSDSYHFTEQLEEEQLVQLHELLQAQWWGGNRELEEVRVMLENTSLSIAMLDESNQLAAFCRVLTDFVFRATVYDVMVRADLQGQGLGKHLMDRLHSHPKLTKVSLLYLCCEPDLFEFYQRWGFKVYDERTVWMIKAQRPEA